MCISIGHLSIGHLSALCQEIVSPLSNWESDTLGNTQIRRPLWERTAFSRSNWPYPSDIPADGSANGSSPREKFLGTSENTRWKLRWVEEVGPQPESRAIANAKWLRDNFCLSSDQQLGEEDPAAWGYFDSLSLGWDPRTRIHSPMCMETKP